MSGASNDGILDLNSGVPLTSLSDGETKVGRIGSVKVFIRRDGESVSAFGIECPHLGAYLDEGLIEDGVVHCPWHHACFDLRTGAALAAPAFDPLARYEVTIKDGVVFVSESISAPKPTPARARSEPREPMVIVGGGAAGFAAADALRKGGWDGEIALFSADSRPPYDRTLLTKDYLDGHFGDDRLPIALHDLGQLDVRIALNTQVEGIEMDAKRLRLRGGGIHRYGKLLLATGASPRKIEVQGAEPDQLHYLRSLDDCRRILSALTNTRNIVVLGGSFIGLEAAASLRSRGLNVDVVAPEERPMSKVIGDQLSDLVVAEHRKQGVRFHLQRQAKTMERGTVVLNDGSKLAADLVIVGMGVEPRLGLAEGAGLRIDRGVAVDACLRTSAPDIFAAGDIARWPDPHSGQNIRVEHWVVAQRQAQIAAANMLGAQQPFEVVPFFWTKHFDLSIRYVGHAYEWDEIRVDGSVEARDATVRFNKAGRELAVATVGRDLESLAAESAKMARMSHARSPS